MSGIGCMAGYGANSVNESSFWLNMSEYFKRIAFMVSDIYGDIAAQLEIVFKYSCFSDGYMIFD